MKERCIVAVSIENDVDQWQGFELTCDASAWLNCLLCSMEVSSSRGILCVWEGTFCCTWIRLGVFVRSKIASREMQVI